MIASRRWCVALAFSTADNKFRTQDFLVDAANLRLDHQLVAVAEVSAIEAAGRRRFGCGLLFLLLAVGAK